MQAEALFHIPRWGIGISGFRTCLHGCTREPVTCGSVLAGTCQGMGRKEIGSKFARPCPAVVVYGRLTFGFVGVGVCNADGSGSRLRLSAATGRRPGERHTVALRGTWRLYDESTLAVLAVRDRDGFHRRVGEVLGSRRSVPARVLPRGMSAAFAEA